eukprot:CAMPEP_0182438012 /NCGR_PEP_ID=MMETSP1167-20130531/85442_1 /TAXON_ID=2988 /ORGANISM="Mallomonas Sp, Strain CCMP3275" /LENGTH=244 /DNA_ID=CAMNT_0024631153 /DNA_START=114 /DNA_END=845 /DNA_ORIENTATION=-
MLCRHIRKRCEILYEADNGVQAVEILKESSLAGIVMDVILMDHQMPEMDGPTATKLMRGMGYKGMIIGITGNALPADKQYYLNSGADHILTKPLDMKLLEDLLKSNSPVPSDSHISPLPTDSYDKMPHFASKLMRMLSHPPAEADIDELSGVEEISQRSPLSTPSVRAHIHMTSDTHSNSNITNNQTNKINNNMRHMNSSNYEIKQAEKKKNKEREKEENILEKESGNGLLIEKPVESTTPVKW